MSPTRLAPTRPAPSLNPPNDVLKQTTKFTTCC